MKPSINQALWYVTGGKLPDIHDYDFKKSRRRIYRLKIPSSTTSTETTDLNVPVSTILFESKIPVLRMPVEKTRPVNMLIPFGVRDVPVKGTTIPRIIIYPRLMRFSLIAVINKSAVGIYVKTDCIRLLKGSVNVINRLLWQASAITLPVFNLPSVIHVLRHDPKRIPGYFVRKYPENRNTFDRADLIARRNGIADALGVPKFNIELMEIFKNVDTVNFEGIEYDRRGRTLKMIPMLKKSYRPEYHEMVVGRNIKTGEIHVAKYKQRIR